MSLRRVPFGVPSAYSTRARNSRRPARPSICRFIVFSRFTEPSTFHYSTVGPRLPAPPSPVPASVACRKDGHSLGDNQCRNSAAGPDAPRHRSATAAAGRLPVWSQPHHPAIRQGTPGAAIAPAIASLCTCHPRPVNGYRARNCGPSPPDRPLSACVTIPRQQVVEHGLQPGVVSGPALSTQMVRIVGHAAGGVREVDEKSHCWRRAEHSRATVANHQGPQA